MKNALKGALLSGLVFPGAGQFWLKYYLRGTVLLVAVSAALVSIVMTAARQALTILEKMESSGAVDMVALLRSAGDLSRDPATRSASTILVVCWTLGIVDAYLMGRKKDLSERKEK